MLKQSASTKDLKDSLEIIMKFYLFWLLSMTKSIVKIIIQSHKPLTKMAFCPFQLIQIAFFPRSIWEMTLKLLLLSGIYWFVLQYESYFWGVHPPFDSLFCFLALMWCYLSVHRQHHIPISFQPHDILFVAAFVFFPPIKFWCKSPFYP